MEKKRNHPYIYPEEFSARGSQSNEKDSISLNYARLARITKHQLIMEKINQEKNDVVYKSKKEKEKQRKMIINRKHKIKEDNRRKMLEVQWRLKLAKISTHLHKESIRNIKWKIGGNWSNSKMKSVSTRKSNFNEKNFIWRTTKNVKYTISKTDLDKIPKEEIYETEDQNGNRKLVRKRIIESRVKKRERERGEPSGERRIRKKRRKEYDIYDHHIPEKREGSNGEEGDSTFFIPETPKNEYESYINQGDTIDESFSIANKRGKKRRRSPRTDLINNEGDDETMMPKAINSISRRNISKKKKKKGKKSKTAMNSRNGKSRRNISKDKKKSKSKRRIAKSSSKGRKSKNRSKQLSKERLSSMNSRNKSKGSKISKKDRKRNKKNIRNSRIRDHSSSSINRSMYSRNSQILDNSRSNSAILPRVRPEDRVYPLPMEHPCASYPLYDDDGDDPTENKNPLEIYHPSEDPEIEPLSLIPLHYRPNFNTDNPKNFMGIEGKSFKVSETSNKNKKESETEKEISYHSGSEKDFKTQKMNSTMYNVGESDANILGSGYQPVFRGKDEEEEGGD